MQIKTKMGKQSGQVEKTKMTEGQAERPGRSKRWEGLLQGIGLLYSV
jgi:hypothetical protein